MRKFIVGILLFAVIAVIVLDTCTFVSKPYQKVLISRFGEIITKPTRICYNWYLCWPTDKLIRLDMRLHLYQSNNREVTTSDGEPITIRTYALWKIINPRLYYEKLPGGTPEVQNYLYQKIEGTVLTVMGQYKLSAMFNVNRQKLQMHAAEKEIRGKVNEKLKPLGISIKALGFSRMTFPPTVAVAVYHHMSAEREKIAHKYLSEGASQATSIVAAGKAKATEILSEAQKTATEIRGMADAQAYSIIGNAQTTPQARRFYRFYKSLELFKNSMGDSTYWILSPDNPVVAPLFQQLQVIEKNAAHPAHQTH